MGVAASLFPQTVEIHADEAVTCEVRLRNPGSSPEEVTFRITGDAGPWVSVFPHSITLAPGGEEVARLVIKPLASTDIGERSVPFSVEVVPSGAGTAAVREGPAVVEGIVRRAPSVAIDATLTPRNSRARRSAEHVLRIENTGTLAATSTPRIMSGDDGVRLEFEPPNVAITAGSAASVRVKASARRRPPLGRRERAWPFEILVEVEAEAEDAPPARAEGVLHQQPALPRGALTTLVGAVLLLVAVIAASVTVGNGSSRNAGTDDGATGQPTAAQTPDGLPAVEQHGGHAPPGCPSDTHTDPDPLAHAQTTSQLRKLPRDYSFMFPGADRCQPARFNPCEPVHYTLNPTLAPPGGVEDARAAIAQLAKATGLPFVEDPRTDETITGRIRQPYQPERYGSRWAPILIVWERLGSDPNTPQAAGRGGPYVSRPDGVVTSGAVGLNVDAVTDYKTGAKPRSGFQAEGLGVGAIGPEQVTWGRVLLHELAHVVGLGHASDRSQLMYPEASEHIARRAEYGRGDLAGLAVLGRQSGCLRTPPPLRPAS